MTMLLHFARRAISVLLHVALRAVGVALPPFAVMGAFELVGAVPDDFGTFLGATGLSVLAVAVWSATDARRAQTGWAVTVWVATAFVYYAVSGSLLFAVPLLVVAGFGMAVGAAARAPEAKARHTAGAGQ